MHLLDARPAADSGVVIGAFGAERAPRVEEILRATSVFSPDEVRVARELLEEGSGTQGTAHYALRNNVTAGSDGGTALQAQVRGTAADSESLRSAECEVRNSDVPDVPTPSYSFLGAFTPDGELVGFACYGPTPGTDRTYDLYWIAVDPANGRAGIASLLIDEVERRLQGHAARMLVVETSSRSDYLPARGFYARRGYAEVARVAGFYAPDDDRIILTKRIHSPTGRGALSA
ncbi:MAG TPA: GNAT family N-acetyltransferase [Gemmatimonadaceae bacterium]|nr:GNAT family N-acetyltransferase [Gemmatimonadaceae bacterium]